MIINLLLGAFVIGIGATAFMDVSALLQRRIFSLQSLDYAMVGRWLGHVAQGRIMHRPITASTPIPGEHMVGWTAHYAIGVLFGGVFLMIVGSDWLVSPKLVPALAFGALTVLAPYLILQPGMGAGLAARRTPRPNVARLKSLATHLIFGFGLWLTAFVLSVS